MASFSFRSRSKSLDWKLISCVNIDNIIQKTSITDLQGIIDEVTFSSFDKNDAQYINVENLTKLVNLMQLIIEYFLYCQEEQFKSIQTNQQKNNQLRKQKHIMEKKYIAIKEDIKGYKSQLQYLQEILLSYSPVEYENQLRIQQHQDPQQRLINMTSHGGRLPSSSSSSLPIQYLDSILSSERETRENILSVFEKQKVSFIQEIGSILNHYLDHQDKKEQTDFINTVIQHDSKKANEKVVDKIDQLFQLILLNQQQMQMQMQSNNTSSNINMNKENIDDNNNSSSSSSSVSAAVAIAAAHVQITELKERLQEKEAEYRASTNNHLQQQRYLTSQVDELTELNKRQTLYIDTAVNSLSQAKLMAARMMKSTLSQALSRKFHRSFSQWKSYTNHQHARESESEYTRRLKVELKIHARKMDEMKFLLDREKEKVILEKARYSILLRSGSGSSSGSGTSDGGVVTATTTTGDDRRLADEGSNSSSSLLHSPPRSPPAHSSTATTTLSASQKSHHHQLTISVASPTAVMMTGTSGGGVFSDDNRMNESILHALDESNHSSHTQWHDDDDDDDDNKDGTGVTLKDADIIPSTYASPLPSSSSKFKPSQNQIDVFMELLNQLSPNSQERARLALLAADYSDSDKSQSAFSARLTAAAGGGGVNNSLQSSPRQFSSSSSSLLLSLSPQSPMSHHSRTHSQILSVGGGVRDGLNHTQLTTINHDDDESKNDEENNNNNSSMSVYSSINVNNDEEVKETSEWLVQASEERISNQIQLKSEDVLTEEIALILTQRLAMSNDSSSSSNDS